MSLIYDFNTFRLKDRLNELEDINDMSLEEKYNESTQIISQWINQTESLLLSEDIRLTDVNTMKNQFQKLEESYQAAKTHEKSLEAIDSSNSAVSPTVSVDELKARYTEVRTLLEDKHGHLNSCKLSYRLYHLIDLVAVYTLHFILDYASYIICLQ